MLEKAFGKCLEATSGCYGCGNNDRKVRDSPTLQLEEERPNKHGPNLDDEKKDHFNVLQASNQANSDEGVDKL